MTRTTERVLDACVIVSAIYAEPFSRAARARLQSPTHFIAPDLIFPELTHVGVKKVRRGLASSEMARSSVERAYELLAEIAPTPDLSLRALALGHQFDVDGYDAVYVALAEARGAPLLTVDLKLAAKLKAGGLGELIETLEPDL